MSVDDDILKTLQEMSATLSRNGGAGSVGGGFDNRTRGVSSADAINQKKAETVVQKFNDSVRGASQSFSALKKDVGAVTNSATQMSSMFELTSNNFNSMWNNIDYDQIEKAPNILTDSFKKSSSVFGGFVTSLETARSANDFVSSGNLQRYAELKQKGSKRNKEEHKEYKLIRSAYMNMGGSLANLPATMEEANEQTLEFAEGLSDATDKIQHSILDVSKSLVGSIMKIGAAIAAIATPSIIVAKSAAKSGMQLDVMGLKANSMGMQVDELNSIQKENIQTMRSSGLSFDQFNDAIDNGASGLTGFTGNMADSMRVSSQAFSMARTLGAHSEEERNKFMKEQTDRFRILNHTLGITAEEFVGMNEQLSNSQSVQSNLYRLNLRQRAAYMTDLQNTYEKIRVDGLTHEQALKMLEVFSEIGAKSPKERLKEAAKLQATMGAIGMGAQGAEAASLLRGGMRGEGDQARFAELMKGANAQMGDRMGQGLGSEMMMSQLVESTGMGEYLGPNSKFAEFVTQQGATIDSAEQDKRATEATDKNTKALLNNSIVMADIAKAYATGPAAQTAAAVAGAAELILGDIFKLLAGAFGALGAGGAIGGVLGGISKFFAGGKLASTIGSALTKPFGMLKTLFTRVLGPLAALYGAWKAGEWLGKKINENLDKDTKDTIGSAVAHTLAFFGNDAAQAAIDSNERIATKAHEIAREQNEKQKQQDSLNKLIAGYQKRIEAGEDQSGQIKTALDSLVKSFDLQVKATTDQTKIITEQTEVIEGTTNKTIKANNVQSRMKAQTN